MSNKGLTQKSAPAASVSVVEDRDVQGLFIKKLQLQEGAKAIVRLLTEGRDVIDDTFHRQVPKQVKTTIFKTDVLCTLPNGSCKHCDEGLYKTAKMFLTWVWVEKIFYKNKPNAQYNPTTLEKRYILKGDKLPEGFITGLPPTTGKKLNTPYGVFDSVAKCMVSTKLTRYAIECNLKQDKEWFYIKD